MNWFNFTGTDPSKPSHYTLLSALPTCVGPTQKMCALQATNDGNAEPIITESLKDEMIYSLENQVNNSNVRLKSR
jgi:hypothetical protein